MYISLIELFRESTRVSFDVFTYLRRRMEWDVPELYFTIIIRLLGIRCVWVFNIFSNAVNILL